MGKKREKGRPTRIVCGFSSSVLAQKKKERNRKKRAAVSFGPPTIRGYSGLQGKGEEKRGGKKKGKDTSKALLRLLFSLSCKHVVAGAGGGGEKRKKKKGSRSRNIVGPHYGMTK